MSLRNTLGTAVRWQKERLARWSQERDRFERFLTMGHAGGAIATLSFMGTLLGGGSPALPPISFWVFVEFLIGLACALRLRYIEHQWPGRGGVADEDVHALRIALNTSRNLLTIGSMWSLVAGVSFGLVFLYALTG